ncbi:MAG TPA: alpha/beta fold hydrolase, partial [Verrucomicrobiae bacterium]|nr:alpha/beta fold hydrolase [Verrucomicrobiae bacterium]
MAPLNSDIWAPALKIRPNRALRLFCFPYAGGGLPVFRGWPDALPESVEVRVIQLPGRGPRFREKRFEDLANLARVLSAEIEPLLVDQPFALFGHSFGALLAFETARQLRTMGWIPERLIASGNNAPHIPEPLPPIHGLPDEAFLEELKLLNGIQPAVLESQELLELFLPIIRSDFKML